MIGYIVVILFLWFLNAFTTDDRYAKTKAMFWLFEGCLMWFAFGWPMIMIIVPVAWILKDMFLNYFQLKQRGWNIILYGGNNKGDTATKIIRWVFGRLDPFLLKIRRLNHVYGELGEQDRYDIFQMGVKITSLIIAVLIYLGIIL